MQVPSDHLRVSMPPLVHFCGDNGIAFSTVSSKTTNRKMSMTVKAAMPLTTRMPMDFYAATPAPLVGARGNTPRH